MKHNGTYQETSKNSSTVWGKTPGEKTGASCRLFVPTTKLNTKLNIALNIKINIKLNIGLNIKLNIEQNIGLNIKLIPAAG